MSNKPNDRLKTEAGSELVRPEIYTIIDGKKFPRPGLETVFAESEDYRSPKGQSDEIIGGAYCSCNKVCRCIPVRGQASKCGCVGHSTCSCVGHSTCSCVGHSSRGGVVTGCRCAPVH